MLQMSWNIRQVSKYIDIIGSQDSRIHVNSNNKNVYK